LTNYFDLFDLPVGLEIDQSALTKKYYALNKEYHPDKFTLSDESTQAHSMSMSTTINEGFKTLKKKQGRIKHILELLDVAPTEGNESMPQEFLMEMMDVNEAIMEYKMEPSEKNFNKVNEDIKGFESDLEVKLEELSSQFDFENPTKEHLTTLKDYYLKSKYLRRLKDNLQDREAEI